MLSLCRRSGAHAHAADTVREGLNWRHGCLCGHATEANKNTILLLMRRLQMHSVRPHRTGELETGNTDTASDQGDQREHPCQVVADGGGYSPRLPERLDLNKMMRGTEIAGRLTQAVGQAADDRRADGSMQHATGDLSEMIGSIPIRMFRSHIPFPISRALERQVDLAMTLSRRRDRHREG